VFSDPEAMGRLNELVHPPLLREIESRIASLERSQAASLIVVDAALHFVFSPRIRCDAVLLTKTAPEIQLQRIMQRDGLDEERARERLKRQSAIAEHEGEADYVLDTTAEPSQVRRELLLNMDALLGTSLVLSDPIALNRDPEDRN
jgi:dephospho-CoA kinase